VIAMQVSDNTALLVIDVQKGFDDPKWGARNNPLAESQIARLLAAFRVAGRTIIHVQHDSVTAAGIFRPGTTGHEHKAEAMPLVGEAIYHKSVNSAFIGTALERDLRQLGIDSLIITGLTTNHCVSTSTRMAGNLGFDTYIVADATATFERRALDGSMRPAEEVHLSALSDLSDEFATVTLTRDVLAALHVGRRARALSVS
jgi:nicotinamidase-related amidase